MLKPFYFLPVLFLLSCKHEQRHISIFKTMDVVLVDTSFMAAEYMRYNQHEAKFPIYYIGKPMDTINIGSSYQTCKTYWVNDLHTLRTKKLSRKNLSIFVDTCVKTTITHEYINQDGKVLDDSSKHYKAYLLTIKNISDTALWLGYTFSLTLLNREIKDKYSKWIRPDSAIDKTGICTTGKPMIILKTGEILLAKVRRYKGNILTDCRFALGWNYYGEVVYSNVFKDSVDERLFDQ